MNTDDKTEIKAKITPKATPFGTNLSDIKILRFEDWYQTRIAGQRQLGLYLAAFIFSAFFIVDLLFFTENKYTAGLIRLFISISIYAIAYNVPKPWFIKNTEAYTSLSCILAGFGLIAIFGLAPDNVQYWYCAGLLLVQIFAVNILKLKAIYGLFVNVTIIASYLIISLVFFNNHVSSIAYNTIFLLAVGVMTLLARIISHHDDQLIYIQERSLIQQRFQLTKQNADLQVTLNRLESANDEKAAFFAAYARATPGSSLEGKYILEEPIGSGGLGTVYRARHKELRYDVAIKLIRTSIPNQEEQWYRMKREAILTSSIQHPNAIRIFDFGISNGIPYIVMELLDGEGLNERLKRDGPMSIAQAINIIRPISQVLEICHSKGVIHRDIKPSNIFLHHLQGNHIVKLIDFGIAKSTELMDKQLTQTGLFIGTLNYSAPEMVLQGELSAAVDIYSLGVLFYEILSGQSPFAERVSLSPHQSNHRVLIPLQQYCPEVPNDIAEIVMSLMAPNPAQRPELNVLNTILNKYNL